MTLTIEPPAHADPMIGYALRRILRQYGHDCIVDRKTLNKFGGNPTVGTSLVSINSWGQDEVFQSSNVTLRMSSSSAADTGITVYIEKMYLDTTNGNNFVFGVSSSNVINGQNKVTLDFEGVRWMRMYTDNNVVGDVYLYRDGAITGGVPDDLTTVHCHIPAGANQSQKASTSIAYNNYFLMEYMWADIVKKGSVTCGIYFLERQFGKDFRVFPRRSCSSHHDLDYPFRSYRIVPPNYDILLKAVSDTVNTDVTGGFDGEFADIQNLGFVL